MKEKYCPKFSVGFSLRMQGEFRVHVSISAILPCGMQKLIFFFFFFATLGLVSETNHCKCTSGFFTGDQKMSELVF